MRGCRRSFAKMPTKWETLRWLGGPDGQLVLLDQTCLPAQLCEVTCWHVDDVWHAIRVLRVRGAPGDRHRGGLRRGARLAAGGRHGYGHVLRSAASA